MPTEDKNLNQEKTQAKTGIAHVFRSLGYSLEGLKASYTECSIRQLMIFHGVLIALLFILDFDMFTRMILLMASFLSFIVELFNTALEAAVDHTSMEKNPLAKRAKDTASAAQLVAITLLVILWLMALWHDYFTYWL